MQARVSQSAYYEVAIAESDPNSDFDSDIVEEPWQDIRTRMRPIPPPVLALHRLHENRVARVTADGVPAELAQSFARAMQPAAEECLVLAEAVRSHDHYCVGTITSIAPWNSAAANTYLVDAEPHELVTMRIEETDKGAPFAKGTEQRFAVADAKPFREVSTQRKSYWLRADTESGKTTFALARTVSMIDDDDRCPDLPLDAGPDAARWRRDAGEDLDGCP